MAQNVRIPSPRGDGLIEAGLAAVVLTNVWTIPSPRGDGLIEAAELARRGEVVMEFRRRAATASLKPIHFMF